MRARVSSCSSARRTLALARQWRQDAGSDDAAIVRRALDWIRRDFGYTLASSLAGRNAVDQFLFVDKRGYCEHFSSSFVVLMRAAGIPARGPARSARSAARAGAMPAATDRARARRG